MVYGISKVTPPVYFDPVGKSCMVDKINQGTPIEAHDNKGCIYFPVDTHETFFKYILSDDNHPTIPPGYGYKFPENIEKQNN